MIDRDLFQLSQTPIVAVPRHNTLAQDDRQDGHRYLVSGDGIFLEVIRSWIHIVTRIGFTELDMPFGDVEEKLHIKCGKLPSILLQQFVELARASLPNETAALIVWCEQTNQFRLLPTAVRSSVGTVHYQIPPLGQSEYRVVDIHSHGHIKAFFSSTDDIDDQHDLKIAVVVGELGKDKISIAARACVLGKYIDLNDLITGDLYEAHVQTTCQQREGAH